MAHDLRRSTGRAVVELTADSDTWETASKGEAQVFVGTDALLHRMPRADVVVFCDVDRDVLAPYLSASREFLSRLVRAARLVGTGGSIVLQSRMVTHPLLAALGSGNVEEAVRDFLEVDLQKRSELGLPPMGRVVRVEGNFAVSATNLACPGVQLIAGPNEVILRGSDDQQLTECLEELRVVADGRLRVYADPLRF